MDVTVNDRERICTLTMRWQAQNLYVDVYHAQHGNAPRPSRHCYPMRYERLVWKGDFHVVQTRHEAAVAAGAAFGQAITFNQSVLQAPEDDMRIGISFGNATMQDSCFDRLQMASDLAGYLLVQGSSDAARCPNGSLKASPHAVGRCFSDKRWQAKVQWEEHMLNKQLASNPTQSRKRASQHPDVPAANKRLTKIPISTPLVSRPPTPAPQTALPKPPSRSTPPMPSLSCRMTTVDNLRYGPHVGDRAALKRSSSTSSMLSSRSVASTVAATNQNGPRFSGEDPFHFE